jgi:hypothetical protein
MAKLSHNLVRGFASLFWGREGVYFDSTNERAAYGPLNLNLFRNHLLGKLEIGTYPIDTRGLARWGCIDVDENSLDKALNVAAAYQSYNIVTWLERSRSKGYHIWVFTYPMPAAILRKAGLVAIHMAGLPAKTEVNPKQFGLWHMPKPKDAPSSFKYGIGNTVRLPYSGSALPGRMQCLAMLGSGLTVPLTVSQFVPRALAGRNGLGRLMLMADAYRPLQQDSEAPGRKQAGTITGPSHQRQEAWEVIDESTKKVVEKGERDNQIYTAVRLMYAKGYEKYIALDRVKEIWEEQILNKDDFPLREALAKVDRIYGH